MNVVGYVSLAIVFVAAALTVWRAVLPVSVADRSVAIDALTAMISGGLLIGAALRADALLVDLALVFGLVGFLATVTVARFIERRGS